MSGTKSRPPQSNGGARRRLEPAGSGIGSLTLPESSYRVSHIAVEEEPDHRKEEEKWSVDPDFCHDLPLKNRPVENGCEVEGYLGNHEGRKDGTIPAIEDSGIRRVPETDY